jgi:hypothetical protein
VLDATNSAHSCQLLDSTATASGLVPVDESGPPQGVPYEVHRSDLDRLATEKHWCGEEYLSAIGRRSSLSVLEL